MLIAVSVVPELIAISVILPWFVDPGGVIRYMPHIQVENWDWSKRWKNRFHRYPFLWDTISVARRWRNTTSAPVDCEDSILVRVHRGTGAGLSPTDASSLAATATSAKLGIFRWSRWANAATAVISAVLKPLPPMRRLNNGC
ncbi:ROK family protein [Salmonella enterica subsp. enterica]|nr:ROK family protein [Salmonella enterica subsp. enterica]